MLNGIDEKLEENSKAISVSGSCDVLVVGGGIAGVAAAVAAARNSADVCLIEKEFALGGLATLGNVVYYLPLCDGMGNQVIGGLGEELLKLSVTDGFDSVPPAWADNASTIEQRKAHRYRVKFNPMWYMLELERFVLENGVKLLYDTRFCDVIKNGSSIDAAIVENKSGRSAIRCKTLVDASGDADVCFKAGEETVSLSTNSRSGWFYYFDGSKVVLDTFATSYDSLGKTMPDGGRGFAGDDAGEVTDFVVETRKLIRQRLESYRTENSKVLPLFMPSIPCFRMTRRLKSDYELEESDDKKYFEDSLGMTGDWRKKGPVFFLPLRSLAATRTDNLISAGRCISAGETGWDITRVIPACVATGEAAGTAAAVASSARRPEFSSLDIPALQAKLIENGVIIRKL